jgi:glycosyltransferase involved in cell wall biosynthesis
MTLVTIGLCVKNSEDTIKATLESIIGQDFPHDKMELVVVDGDSIDKTLEIANDLIETTKIKTRFFNDKGEGLGAARQIVVENATGEYIVWIDADVILKSDFLHMQLDFMRGNPSLGMARGRGEYKSSHNLVADVQNLLFCARETVYMGATICRTKVVREVGGFDKLIQGAAEDDDFRIRMTQKGWKSSLNDVARFTHSPRRGLKNLFREYSWYGYGGHFIKHKHSGMVSIIYWFPPVFLGWGLKTSRRSYRQYYKKESFLIPLLCSFMILSWWFGFYKSHTDNYGH